MTVALALAGAALASLSHVYVSRHAPPPGWGWAWCAYELVPWVAIAGTQWLPERTGAILGVAAAVAVVMGPISALVARGLEPQFCRVLRDADGGEAVRITLGASSDPSRAEIETDAWAAHVRRREAARRAAQQHTEA